MLTWLFAAVRIVANPVSHAFQKRLAQRSANPLCIIAATHALLTLACLPLLSNALERDAGTGAIRLNDLAQVQPPLN
jgi:hypothetical protein